VDTDDISSYVILSIFFSHFYLVLIQDRRVLEQLSMVFRTFYNIFISSHVILVFPKHNHSTVFWCISRRNHANRQSKASSRFEKTMNEDLRGLWRHYKREKFYSKSQNKLHGRKHPKDKEICLHARKYTNTPLGHQPRSLSTQNDTKAPWECFMCPGHVEKSHMRLKRVTQAPPTCWFREITVFCYFYMEKTQFLGLNPSGNQAYKYKSSHYKSLWYVLFLF